MGRRLITAKNVREGFGNKSDMTLHRWVRDPKLNFPKPIYINGRRYFDADEIEHFKSRAASERH